MPTISTASDRYREDRTLKVGVTGSTGLIGHALCAMLTTGGHRVVRLRRDAGALGPDDALWNPGGEPEDMSKLEGLDAVVHLAGEPLLGLRWTDEKKQRIWQSRVKATEWLARTLAQLRRPPRVLVASSAVGVLRGPGQSGAHGELQARKGVSRGAL